MSEQITLTEQQAILNDQIETVEEIKEHLIKAMSVLDLVTSSLEKKEGAENLDIASELNSMVTVYDNLDHAFQDAHEVQKFLEDQQNVDKAND